MGGGLVRAGEVVLLFFGMERCQNTGLDHTIGKERNSAPQREGFFFLLGGVPVPVFFGKRAVVLEPTESAVPSDPIFFSNLVFLWCHDPPGLFLVWMFGWL